MKTLIRLGLLVLVAAAIGGLAAGETTREASATFPGDNGRIAFYECCEGQISRIYTANADGSDVVRITDGPDDQSPEWSPNGLEIAFASRRNGEWGIYLMNADGSGERRLTAGTAPAWSPDGDRIAFVRDSDIWIVNADGSNEFNFTDDGLFNGLPDWSPDGKKIAFVSKVRDAPPPAGGIIVGVFTMTTDRVRTLVAETGGPFIGNVDWSPDSARITYSDLKNGVFVVDAAGGNERLLVPDGAGDPGWSPDGEWIVFERGFFADEDGLSVVLADGSSEPVPITNGRHLSPDWGVSTQVLHSVEFTQAIQQWQTMGALKGDLANDGMPPVPIVAGKPAVMRVYFKTFETGDFTVEVSGAVNDEIDVELSEDCTPAQRRAREGTCTSVDFYFTPPVGNWSVTLRVSDEVGPVETHTFNLTSVTTRPMRVVPVDVCDRQAVPVIGTWECQYGFNLWPNSDRLRAIFPGEVIFEASAGQVRNDAPVQSSIWWNDTLNRVGDLWTGAGADPSLYYHGAVRGGQTGSANQGLASISGHNGLTAVPSSVGTAFVLAHELGHNAGRSHVSAAGGGSGCFGTPTGTDPNWPHSDPFIQEVGFNVETGEAIDPEIYADIMSYCTPGWISIYTYLGMMSAFQQNARVRPEGTEVADHWLISGEFSEAGDSADLDFITELYTEGPTGEGSGEYRIEVLNDSADVLVARNFDAHVASGEDGDSLPRFSELVRITGSPEKIVVLGPQDEVLAEVELEGERPQVTVSEVSRSGLSGEFVLSWQIEDPDSSEHESWVQYSTDGGTTWEVLTPRVDGTQLALDAATLAGSDEAMFQVLVSDGVWTGQAQSNTFSVATKPPVAEITGPGVTSFREGQLVWLQGMGFDEEDGFLDGGDVRWSSSRDGTLGTGASLHVYDLSVGTHTITMTAEDSDGGEATDTISVTVTAGGVNESGQISGDIDCSGAVDSVDGLGISRHVAGLSVGQTQPCPAIGVDGHGDVNCDDAVTAVDSLFVLRHVAGLPVNLPQGCRAIGT